MACPSIRGKVFDLILPMIECASRQYENLADPGRWRIMRDNVVDGTNDVPYMFSFPVVLDFQGIDHVF
jgi:hypothetical protein